jgi:hypothetical protein
MIPKKNQKGVNSFFALFTQRKLTAAKRVLDEITQQIRVTPWHKGYIAALQGMLVATVVKGDNRLLINKINFDTYLQRHAFHKEAHNELHADFDRGFFAAWTEYTDQVVKIQTQTKINGY